jgi:hypothetical protein
MGGVWPETCWALHKHGIIYFGTLLHLVGYFLLVTLATAGRNLNVQNQRVLVQFWAPDDGWCVVRNMLSFTQTWNNKFWYCRISLVISVWIIGRNLEGGKAVTVTQGKFTVRNWMLLQRHCEVQQCQDKQRNYTVKCGQLKNNREEKQSGTKPIEAQNFSEQ